MYNFKDTEEDIDIIPKVRIITSISKYGNYNSNNTLYKKIIPIKNNTSVNLNTKIVKNNINNVLKDIDNVEQSDKNSNQYNVPTNIYKPEILPSKAQLIDKTVNYDLEEENKYNVKNKKVNNSKKNKIDRKKTKININCILSEETKKRNLQTYSSRNNSPKFQTHSGSLTRNNSKKKTSFGNNIFPINKSRNKIKTNINTIETTHANYIDIHRPIFKTLYAKNKCKYTQSRNSINNCIELKKRLFVKSIDKNPNIVHRENKFILLTTPVHKKVKSNECTNKKIKCKYENINSSTTRTIDINENKKKLSPENKKLIKVKVFNQKIKQNIIKSNGSLERNKKGRIIIDLTKIKKFNSFDSNVNKNDLHVLQKNNKMINNENSLTKIQIIKCNKICVNH